MKPYYEQDGITIYHGDCRVVLPFLGVVDSVVTDPPYGIGLRNGDVDGHRSERDFFVAGDNNQEAGQEILNWAESQGLITIAFASPWKPWAGQWRNLIVWDKGGAVGGGGDIATCLKRTWELIQVARNPKMLGSRAESVWRYPMTPAGTSLHICAKPVPLLEELIYRFTNGTILDPFLGSGTTLLAAKLCGRRAIGIELEERYCEIAANRLRQGVLFN